MLVGQTVATTVESTGGWAEPALKQGATRWSAAASVDDPEDADLASGYRARNVTGWGNVLREFGGGLSAGFEVSRWETRYFGLAKGSSLRAQPSVICTFWAVPGPEGRTAALTSADGFVNVRSGPAT